MSSYAIHMPCQTVQFSYLVELIVKSRAVLVKQGHDRFLCTDILDIQIPSKCSFIKTFVNLFM